jgi:hypothetical protein
MPEGSATPDTVSTCGDDDYCDDDNFFGSDTEPEKDPEDASDVSDTESDRESVSVTERGAGSDRESVDALALARTGKSTSETPAAERKQSGGGADQKATDPDAAELAWQQALVDGVSGARGAVRVRGRGPRAANEGPAIAALAPPPHRWIVDARTMSQDNVRRLSSTLCMARHAALASDGGSKGSRPDAGYEAAVADINAALVLDGLVIGAAWAAARVRRPVAAAAKVVEECETDIHNARNAKRNPRAKLARAYEELNEARREHHRVGSVAVNSFRDTGDLYGRLLETARRLDRNEDSIADSVADVQQTDDTDGANPKLLHGGGDGERAPSGWYHGGDDPLEWHA